MDKVTDEKLKSYMELSEKALAMAKEHVDDEKKKEADVIIDMVSRYISDAKHFMDKGDKLTAFAALNYAHGWLDSGAMLGIFKVKDSTLFTAD